MGLVTQDGRSVSSPRTVYTHDTMNDTAHKLSHDIAYALLTMYALYFASYTTCVTRVLKCHFACRQPVDVFCQVFNVNNGILCNGVSYAQAMDMVYEEYRRTYLDGRYYYREQKQKRLC